jgi:signal transduction histidine kinase/integral membrane sensor domain MASE1
MVRGSSGSVIGLRKDYAATIAVASGAAYYLGSVVGLELRLPPATPSVLWPPNAILTALLLFVPAARWWSVVLGAALAHFAVQLPVWSASFVTAIFLTNCSEALVAATLIRRFNRDPSRLDTLPRVSVFIAAAVLAPFVSSFLDAGVVTLIHGESYWGVWRVRFLSNVLAQLAVVPAVLGVLNLGDRASRWPRGRWIEGTAIAVGMVLVSLAIAVDAGAIGLSNAPLAPLLPFLLWAAVRFGSLGVGVSVLGTVLVAVVSALYGDGLFSSIPSHERIRTLQVFLICATVPMMCIGALVEERQRDTKALLASDSLKASILTSIPSLVAVIDRKGQMLAVNDSWTRAREDGALAEFAGQRGASYLETWAAAAERGSPDLRAGFEGVMSVLDGRMSAFALEYCSDGREAPRWWLMSVVPLKTGGGGAVITHTDITARKRAEAEAQQLRAELAHTARVWVMGELTASLSHQLKQPLAAIIGNAEAGSRLLETRPPDVVEVRQILDDIATDAERACDITAAIRDMLRKDEAEDELLDVNEVVRSTTMLVRSEAAERSVSFELQLEPMLPPVRGSRVQLHQVVLNLAMNAIEAMADLHKAARIVTIRTESRGPGVVQVSVVDTGCGLPLGAEEQIFEPLFTTKKSGMGMGLSIARSIIEAHGGTIAAERWTPGGTAVHFTLPACGADSLESAALPRAPQARTDPSPELHRSGASRFLTADTRRLGG